MELPAAATAEEAADLAMAVDLLEEFTSKLVISSDSEEGGVIS